MTIPRYIAGVLIPFHKNEEQLAKCKKALEGQIEYVKHLDDSATGHGFTKTVNILISEHCMPTNLNEGFAIILNQDCYLKPDAIEKMVTFMQAHPKCAIAGIKQLSSQDPDHIIHGGTYECFPTGRHEGGLVSRGDCNESKQVPWVNGACMIVRLEAIAEIGLMDPNYKMFGSDADWSYTARQRGWETWYIAEAECVHEQGASKGLDEKMSKVFEADMRYFRDKWITDDCFRELSMEVF